MRTYDGLRKLQPDERPFVLTRAAYSGTQRYAATWTGDNSSTWNHLKMSTPMLLSMGVADIRWWETTLADSRARLPPTC